jgi:GNAT superfamily N-acetyltransferase
MPIRQAAEKDISAIAHIYVQSWLSTYRNLLPESFLRAVNPLNAEKTFRESFQSEGFSYFILLAENPEGETMGYLDGGRDREDPGKSLGEIYGMYLLEAFQGRGMGRELLREAFQKFKGLGFTGVRTWVLREGLARGFYEKAGGRIEGVAKNMMIGKDYITLVSYHWDL